MSRVVKKIGISFAALFCLCLLCILFPGGMRALAANEKAVLTSSTELRSGPGASYTALTSLPAGTQVTVQEQTDAAWSRVSLANGRTGYVKSAYLGQTAELPDDKAITGATKTYLRVRSGPGADFRSLTTLPPGTTVNIVDNRNPLWAKIELSDGTVGYCSKDAAYLTITETAITPPTPPDPNVIDNPTVTIVSHTGTAKAYLNVRTGPGISYPVLTTLANGAQVTATDVSNPAWAKVRLSDGREGYCSTAFLSVISTETTTYAELRSGNKGAAVTKMQDRLRALHYLTGASSGVFDAATLAALKTFQTVAGLSPVDGVATHTVLERLYASDAPENPDEQPEEYETLSPGMSGENVRILQKRLRSLHYFTTAVDGGYGNITTLAVKDFQKAAGLPVTGTADVETQKKLYASSAPKNTLTGSVFATVLNIRSGPGTNYDLIAQLQEFDKVTVLDFDTDGWYEIRFTANGVEKTGYASAEWVHILATNVWLDASSATLKTGETKTLKATVTTTLTQNQSVKWTTSNAQVATVSSSGVVTAVSAGTATITATTQDGTGRTAQFTVTVTGTPSVDSIKLSHTSGTVPQGKTFYIRATTQPGGKAVYWSTSNPAVATVEDGYILGVGKGTATITARDSSGLRTATCTVTVTDAEAVRFAYASPNIVTLGGTVTLVAITDQTRDGVRFVIDLGNGQTKTVNAASKTADGGTYVWKGSVKMDQAGSFKVKAYSSKNGVMSTDYEETSTFVTQSKDTTTTALERRLVSDPVIDFIATNEGFISKAYDDPLVSSSVPTIGHGYTFSAGALIYNNITRQEAWALLVQTVNNGAYTTEVNKFLLNNQIRFNQQQFDAMVSFSYNIGAYYWNNPNAAFDVRDDMLGAYDPNAGDLTATVTASPSLWLREGPGTGYNGILLMTTGTKVTVLETKTDAVGWYKVKTSNGTIGYCSATYLQLSSSGGAVRDLNYVNANALINDMIVWHHAGNQCYEGLLKRRYDELEMFLYGDYVVDGQLNKYHFPRPSCMQ